jgi:hypothetical protein
MSTGRLGELLRAWHAMGAQDDATRRAVGELLCPELEWNAIPESIEAIPPTTPEVQAPKARTDSQPVVQDREEKVLGDAEISNQLRAVAAPFRARRARRKGLAVPHSTMKLEEDRVADPVVEPLLDPRWSREVLAYALAKRSHRGELDLPAVIRNLATLSPMAHLPRLPADTLQAGAQVLVDRSSAMMVFFADQSAVASEIEAVAGRDRTALLRCDGVPPVLVAGLRSTNWSPYAPPAPGVPVLILSDLGLTRGADPLMGSIEAPWEVFLRTLEERGSPVIALVPDEPDSYAPLLRRRVQLLKWDAMTRPSDAWRLRWARP